MEEEPLRVLEERLRALFVRGLAGDASSYRMVLLELSGRLRAYFRRRLFTRPQDAEDLVQETLIALHNQRHTYDVTQPLTAWVFAIARYKLVDVLRGRERADGRNESLDDTHDALMSADGDAAEAKRDVAKLLEQLPERQRMPIVHVKLQGLSVAEASARLGMSESAIKVAVHRGLKALAAMIKESR